MIPSRILPDGFPRARRHPAEFRRKGVDEPESATFRYQILASLNTLTEVATVFRGALDLSGDRISDGVTVIRSVSVDGFTATDLRLPKSADRARHGHRVGRISLVVESGWSERVGDSTRKYVAGDIVVRPAGAPEVICAGCESARLLVIEFGRKRQHELSGIFPAMDAPVRIHAEVFDGIASRMARALSSSEPTSRLELSSVILELVVGISRLLSRPSIRRELPDWLRAAVRLVESRFREPIALGHVARSVGVSPVRLAQEFRRLRGCSMGSWLRRQRVRVSAERLIGSGEPVRNIATTTGFHDASHLTREFKRATGMTPAAFRRSAR